MATVVSSVIQPITNIVNWIINSVANAVPLFLSGVIIVLVGWLLSLVIEKIVRKSLKELNFMKWEKKEEISKALFGIKLSDLITFAVKWYIVILFISEAATEVNLQFVSSIIQSVLLMVPNWILGTFFMVVSLIIANKVSSAVEKSKFLFGKIGARAIYFVIVYFALVLSLPKFGFENISILTDTFIIIVAGVSLGGALAIGIGFGAALKDPAQKMIKDLLK